MKKMFAIVLALMLCVTVLSVAAFAAEGDTVTVHAQVPADWDSAYVYSWVKDGNGPAWPGDAMTQEGDWWVGSVDAGNNMVIISNNGAPQTIDIEVEAGKEVWLVLSDAAGDDGKFTATVSYEAPAAEGGETTEGGNETTDTENAPQTGDLSIAAVSVALLAATAGLVATVAKKKEN